MVALNRYTDNHVIYPTFIEIDRREDGYIKQIHG